MTDPTDLGERSVRELVQAVQSEHVSPGSGAATATVLALAAACAGKAVSVTLKHHPDQATLLRSRTELAALAEHALAGASLDAEQFAAFVRSRTPDSACRLVRAGESLRQSAAALAALLGQIEPLIDAVVVNDIRAARVLCEAFLAIETALVAENRNAAQSAAAPGC